MNIEDLKPLWQNYKAKTKEESFVQDIDIQLIINKNYSRKSIIHILNQRMMNVGLYLFLLICTNGC